MDGKHMYEASDAMTMLNESGRRRTRRRNLKRGDKGEEDCGFTSLIVSDCLEGDVVT